jgi:hypothetical protein
MNVSSTNMQTGTELVLRPGKGMTQEEELLDCMRMCVDMLKDLNKQLEGVRRMKELGIHMPWEEDE